MLTFKKVNAEIEKSGYNYELVQGEGYLYFWPKTDNTVLLYDDSICVNKLNHTTIKNIMQDLEYKVKETIQKDYSRQIDSNGNIIIDLKN